MVDFLFKPNEAPSDRECVACHEKAIHLLERGRVVFGHEPPVLCERHGEGFAPNQAVSEEEVERLRRMKSDN